MVYERFKTSLPVQLRAKRKFTTVVHIAGAIAAYLLSAGCQRSFTSPSIEVFGDHLQCRSAPVQFDHAKHFLDLFKLDSLRFVTWSDLSSDQMNAIADALLATTATPRHPNNIAFLFVYTTHPAVARHCIAPRETHAFSVVTVKNQSLFHQYFVRGGGNTFKNIPTLDVAFNGPVSIDDIRLLHFAEIGSPPFPKSSTVYVFASRDVPAVAAAKMGRRALRTAVLSDESRIAAAATLGVNGHAIYDAFGIPMMANGWCSNLAGVSGEEPDPGPSGCQSGGGDCVVDTENAGHYCTGGDPSPEPTPEPPCAATAIVAAFEHEGIVLQQPVDLVALSELRDQVLLKSGRGRRMISQYYLASPYVRLDAAMLPVYVKLVPHFNQMARNLLAGSDGAIIVTTELKDIVLTIISQHRAIADAKFQQILDDVENDFKHLNGLKRAEFLRVLQEPVPRANTQRR